MSALGFTAHFGDGTTDPQHRVLVETARPVDDAHGVEVADYTVPFVVEAASADAALAGGWRRIGDLVGVDGGLFHTGGLGASFCCDVERI